MKALSDAERAWAGCSASELERLGLEAAERGDRRELETVMAELRFHRSTKRAKELLALLEQRFQELVAEGPPTSWLDEVRRIAATFEPSTEGSCCVYLVLLSEPGDQFGVYVGESGLSPEDRFANHKRGYKASKHVRDRGIRLIPVPHLQGMHRDESVSIERRLIRRLKKAGFIARGG
ncbi:MAG: hypothetical protein JJ863_38490 [Deltaproteobacteria bacterium]|nr:hypothetical protein [Deltaproteobacteria bacterium]